MEVDHVPDVLTADLFDQISELESEYQRTGDEIVYEEQQLGDIEIQRKNNYHDQQKTQRECDKNTRNYVILQERVHEKEEIYKKKQEEIESLRRRTKVLQEKREKLIKDTSQVKENFKLDLQTYKEKHHLLENGIMKTVQQEMLAMKELELEETTKLYNEISEKKNLLLKLQEERVHLDEVCIALTSKVAQLGVQRTQVNANAAQFRRHQHISADKEITQLEIKLKELMNDEQELSGLHMTLTSQADSKTRLSKVLSKHIAEMKQKEEQIEQKRKIQADLTPSDPAPAAMTMTNPQPANQQRNFFYSSEAHQEETGPLQGPKKKRQSLKTKSGVRSQKAMKNLETMEPSPMGGPTSQYVQPKRRRSNLGERKKPMLLVKQVDAQAPSQPITFQPHQPQTANPIPQGQGQRMTPNGPPPISHTMPQTHTQPPMASHQSQQPVSHVSPPQTSPQSVLPAHPQPVAPTATQPPVQAPRQPLSQPVITPFQASVPQPVATAAQASQITPVPNAAPLNQPGVIPGQEPPDHPMIQPPFQSDVVTPVQAPAQPPNQPTTEPVKAALITPNQVPSKEPTLLPPMPSPATPSPQASAQPADHVESHPSGPDMDTHMMPTDSTVPIASEPSSHQSQSPVLKPEVPKTHKEREPLPMFGNSAFLNLEESPDSEDSTDMHVPLLPPKEVTT